MFLRSSFILLGLTLLLTNVQSGDAFQIAKVQEYLLQYGYIRESAWINALKDFQSFVGLNSTGEVSHETLELISKPRCGVPDDIDSSNGYHAKPYSTYKSKWTTLNLTYEIIQYPWYGSLIDIDNQIAKAFDVWSEHTDLSFERVNSSADIKISFFDSKEKTDFDVLAFGFPPNSGGTHVYFDLHQDWLETDFFQVAVHKFGHVLGLKHSSNMHAIMAPLYHYRKNSTLHPDDIAGIQALYGKKSPPRYYVATKSHWAENNPLCSNPKIDAVVTSAYGEIFAFQGDFCYNLYKTIPNLISETWPGLPGNIDAACTDLNNKTLFFKNIQYWSYTGFRLDDGFPKYISDDFPGIPNFLDAALYRKYEHKIYFFKDDTYWEFDIKHRVIVSSIHLSEIDLPSSIDAAFEYEKGLGVVIKDDKYYFFNNINYGNNRLPTRDWMFDC